MNKDNVCLMRGKNASVYTHTMTSNYNSSITDDKDIGLQQRILD